MKIILHDILPFDFVCCIGVHTPLPCNCALSLGLLGLVACDCRMRSMLCTRCESLAVKCSCSAIALDLGTSHSADKSNIFPGLTGAVFRRPRLISSILLTRFLLRGTTIICRTFPSRLPLVPSCISTSSSQLTYPFEFRV